MKKILVFLLMAFLSLTCTITLYSANTASTRASTVSTSTTEAAYSYNGSLIEYDVDYWWIRDVNKDDVVLLHIVPDKDTHYYYLSYLYYSNLTELQYRSGTGTHNHDFVADKTDDYLLKVNAGTQPLNYTINCDTHPLRKEPMHIMRPNLLPEEEYNYWIPNISEDKVFLMSTFPDKDTDYYYFSYLYYSNLTELQYRSGRGTHNHDFVADKTDDYLLKVTSDYALNFTVKHSAPALPTEITFSVEPNPAFVGETVNLLGNLTTHEGMPISNEPVKILSNDTFITTRRTNATGWFEAKGKVGSARTFNLTICYEGSLQYLPCCASQELIVRKVQTWTYAIFIPNPVDVGENCTLRGILVDDFSNPIGFASVKLEYSTDHGLTWHPAGTLTTNSYGVFSKTFKAPSLGTYFVRTEYEGSQSHESSFAITVLIIR